MIGCCAIKVSGHVLLLLDCVKNVLGSRLIKDVNYLGALLIEAVIRIMILS